MPGEAARSVDGDGLFTAPVLGWLHRHGCRGVHALPDVAPGDVPDWITAPVGPHGSPASGWRFGWRDESGGEHRLLLAFAERDALPREAVDALAGYLALAARCAPVPPGPVTVVDRDDVSRRVHDLRNGLNSLLMNAAVVTMKLPPADREGRFAKQVEADGERCAALLQALADTVRPPDPPRSG